VTNGSILCDIGAVYACELIRHALGLSDKSSPILALNTAPVDNEAAGVRTMALRTMRKRQMDDEERERQELAGLREARLLVTDILIERKVDYNNYLHQRRDNEIYPDANETRTVKTPPPGNSDPVLCALPIVLIADPLRSTHRRCI
jgi:hypothetical protein